MPGNLCNNMTTSSVIDRLNHEIGLRTFSDRFLDREEEREVRLIAERMSLEGIEAHIQEICQKQSIIREASLRSQIELQIESLFGKAGKIDEPGFIAVCAAVNRDQIIPEREVKKIVISVMQDLKRTNVRRGWFSNWFTSLKNELCLP